MNQTQKGFIMKINILSLLSLITFYCSSFATFDVVIVSHSKDYETLPLCIASIKKYIPDHARIFVIGNQEIQDKDFTFIHEAKFYGFISPESIKAVWQKHNAKLSSRAPWVFQQFLKLGAPLIIENLSEDYLCIDSDIIFLRPQQFMNKESQFFYSKNRACGCCGKGMIHYEYVHMYKRLMGDRRTPVAKFSFIAHHMMFNRTILQELFEHIQKLHNKIWYDAIVANLNYDSPTNFSEYELYGNWLWNKHPQLLAHRQLEWVSVNDLDKILGQQNYDFVSAQYYDRYNHDMGYPIVYS